MKNRVKLSVQKTSIAASATGKVGSLLINTKKRVDSEKAPIVQLEFRTLNSIEFTIMRMIALRRIMIQQGVPRLKATPSTIVAAVDLNDPDSLLKLASMMKKGGPMGSALMELMTEMDSLMGEVDVLMNAKDKSDETIGRIKEYMRNNGPESKAKEEDGKEKTNVP